MAPSHPQSWPAVLVEAFSQTACGGNGAAVVCLDRALADSVLQAIAGSLNQSETAFLLPTSRGWLLRWFTPSCEVPLCGHATLAATLALGHWQRLAPGQELLLHSRSGPLPVQLVPAEAGSPPQASIVLPSGGLVPATVSPALERYLAATLAAPALAYWHSPLGYRVVLLDEQVPLAQANLFGRALPESERGGLVLMQALRSSNAAVVLAEPCHYQLRFLAPGLGIPEDPVTGSAHALVAPWWMETLGRREVRGWQCSHRPGGMVCAATSSGMIRLSGAGHLLWDGTLQLDSGNAGNCDADAWHALSP